MLLLWMLMGCQNETWSSAEDCENLPMGEAKDQCWSVHLMDVFREDSQTAEQIAEAQIQDSRIRDFVYLGVTREIEPSTVKWCDKMTDPAMKERCQVLVSRPHLHREVLKKKDEKK